MWDMKTIGRQVSDRRVQFWLAMLALLGIAEVFVRGRFVSPAVYAAPSEAVFAIGRLFIERGFFKDVSTTAWLALVSVILGFPLGVLLALALHALGEAQTSGEVVLDFVRSIPITTLIPLFIAI